MIRVDSSAPLYAVPADAEGWRVYQGHRIKLGTRVWIGKGVSLGDGVVLGNDVMLERGVVLLDDVRLGDAVMLAPRVVLWGGVVLWPNVRLGHGVILLADVVYETTPLQIQCHPCLVYPSSLTEIAVDSLSRPIAYWDTEPVELVAEHRELRPWRQYQTAIGLVKQWIQSQTVPR